MIRKAREEDVDSILSVLGAYAVKVIRPEDNTPIDDDYGPLLTVVNEVSSLDLAKAFVALHEGTIVGFCHYKNYGPATVKTTLMTVLPEYRRFGFGRQLQTARMREARESGAATMITFCDIPETALWYRKHFGYTVLRAEPNHHMLHFLPTTSGPIWCIHHGSPDETLQVLSCDLNAFFSRQ